jgi:hypothetical protein
MAKEYSKEELWKLYEKLPQELKEAIFSEETAEDIWNICERNGIEDERVSGVARYTGRVLMGLIPPDEFQENLEKELKLKKSQAKKLAQEINRFIFFPVKASLEKIYKIPIAPPLAGQKAPSPEAGPREEKPTVPPKKDIYREAIG